MPRNGVGNGIAPIYLVDQKLGFDSIFGKITIFGICKLLDNVEGKGVARPILLR